MSIKIIKKKNIKYILWKKVLKVNKNYLKNFKIVFELKNKNSKNNLILFNALNSSHHFLGVYKNNIKNLGWFNKIVKNFSNFKTICFDNINNSYGSSNDKSLNVLNKTKIINFKLNNKNIIKIKNNILNKICIKKIYIIIGASLGGIKSILYSFFYYKKINFSLNIATFKKISLKNNISNNIDLLELKNLFKKKNINNFKNLVNLAILRKKNSINYISKNNILSKKKTIFFKLYKWKWNQKNIFKYLNYKSKFFLKYFRINSYINNIENLKKKININKIYKIFKINLKNIIISFKDDNKFNIKDGLNVIKNYLWLKKKITFKKINSKNGHDEFLIFKNLDYKNIFENLKKIIRSDKIWTYDPLIPNQVR